MKHGFEGADLIVRTIEQTAVDNETYFGDPDGSSATRYREPVGRPQPDGLK